MTSLYRLTLAGGYDLRIKACDAGAQAILQVLAKAMKLSPADGGKPFLVISTGQEGEGFTRSEENITCRFPLPGNGIEVVLRAVQMSLSIAWAVQKRGGILVHGGLAEFQGQGVILAAPGGTGKTTASTRLSPPWRSLSDDAVLIVRDGDGRYFGHPWPTWSRLYDQRSGDSWETSRGIPLGAICFLFRSPDDAIEALAPSQATAMLIESVEQANRAFDRTFTAAEVNENHRRQFSIVCNLTACLPAYRLRLGLTGEFWRCIEDVLKDPGGTTAAVAGKAGGGELPYRQLPAAKADATRCYPPERKVAPPGVIFSGNSMYPTLREPDYLEVVPYGNTVPRRGDVVYFRAPESGAMVVHRVVAVKPEGISTMGDNNISPDPDLVPFAAVAGRVVAARGRNRNSPVRGGAAGMLDFYFARTWRRFLILAGCCYRRLSRAYPLTVSLRYFTPAGIRFRFVFFGKLPHGCLKIMTNDACVGHYSRGSWHIEYPWRLWVDPVKIAAAAARYEIAKRRWQEEKTAAPPMPVGLTGKGPQA